MDRGFMYLDIFLLVICAVLVMVVFFSIISTLKPQKDNILESVIISQNAMVKNNENGIGFAQYDSDLKLVKSYFVSNLSLGGQIDFISVLDTEGNSLLEMGSKECSQELILIDRYGIYDDKVSKIIFGFCK